MKTQLDIEDDSCWGGLKTGEPKSSRVIGSDPSCNRAEVQSSLCRGSCRTRGRICASNFRVSLSADTFVNASELGEERRGEEEDREEKSWKERRGLESGIAFLRSISIRFSRVALLEIVTCTSVVEN